MTSKTQTVGCQLLYLRGLISFECSWNDSTRDGSTPALRIWFLFRGYWPVWGTYFHANHKQIRYYLGYSSEVVTSQFYRMSPHFYRDQLIWPGSQLSNFDWLPINFQCDANDLLSRVNHLVATFCPNLNCIQPFCPTHRELTYTTFRTRVWLKLYLQGNFYPNFNPIKPTVTNANMVHIKGNPCGKFCFRHEDEADRNVFLFSYLVQVLSRYMHRNRFVGMRLKSRTLLVSSTLYRICYLASSRFCVASDVMKWATWPDNSSTRWDDLITTGVCTSIKDSGRRLNSTT